MRRGVAASSPYRSTALAPRSASAVEGQNNTSCLIHASWNRDGKWLLVRCSRDARVDYRSLCVCVIIVLYVRLVRCDLDDNSNISWLLLFT